MRLRSLLVLTIAGALVPATASAAVHTVAPGETLSGIAAVNGLSAAAVAAANGLSPCGVRDRRNQPHDPRHGRRGTRRPGRGRPAVAATGSGYQVAPGDSLSAIAARLGVSRVGAGGG